MSATTRYEVTGHTATDDPAMKHRAVGDVFEARLDKAVESELVAHGAIRVLGPSRPNKRDRPRTKSKKAG